MASRVSREIRLKNRPLSLPRESDFELAEVEIPETREGEILVRNSFMSVDPYMRGRMNDRKSYVPPFQLGQALDGGCVGQVIESRNERFKEGDSVLAMYGWRELFTSDGEGVFKVDPRLAPLQAYLGAMGMPGLTAYYGLLEIGKPEQGETVFVSAAAGAVGSIACQIAKLKGCQVVGSAGSAEKVAWLLEAGVDAAFNYKETEDLVAELGKHSPRGVDIYFENVGGAHLQATLEQMNKLGRVVMCGMISMYNDAEPVPGPTNLAYIIGKQLTVQGFIISDHFDLLPRFMADMSQWIAEGKVKWKETICDGLESAPRALIGLFEGANLGKMIVKI